MNRLAKFALTMLVLDYIYLSSFSGQYNNMMKTIQKSPLKMKPLYALVVYVLMILGWKLLIDKQGEKQSNIVRNSIILGLIIYGVFDFTNLAIFDNYSLKLGLIDMLWGGILFGVSSYVATKKLNLKLY
jgi:uncharacterized membrane protein